MATRLSIETGMAFDYEWPPTDAIRWNWLQAAYPETMRRVMQNIMYRSFF